MRHEASLEFEPIHQVVEIVHALVRKEEFSFSDQNMVRQLTDLELADRGWFSPEQTGLQELSGILGGVLARRCLDAIGLASLVEWLEAEMQKSRPFTTATFSSLRSGNVLRHWKKKIVSRAGPMKFCAKLPHILPRRSSTAE